MSDWFPMDKLINKERDAKEAQRWADHKQWVEDLLADSDTKVGTDDEAVVAHRDELDADMFDEDDFAAWEDDEL